jgi:hypothetical protein
VQAQAVGINVSTGRPGKALEVFVSMGDQSVLTQSARNRLMLDVASAQCDTRQWDACLDIVLQVCTAHPAWARHQALPAAIARRAGHATAATSRFRKLSAILETSQTLR